MLIMNALGTVFAAIDQLQPIIVRAGKSTRVDTLEGVRVDCQIILRIT